MLLEFTVRCLPIAQPRPRATVGFSGHAHVHDVGAKHPVNQFKASIAKSAQDLFPGPLVTTPMAVELLFIFPRPSRLVWKKRAMPREWHQSKPDVENLAKSVLDALTHVVWEDDDQVSCLVLRKVYAAGDEAPGVVVTIKDAPPIASPPVSEVVVSPDPSLFPQGIES